jgi:hypothetical protein
MASIESLVSPYPQYDTKLSPREERDYQAWVKQRGLSKGESHDYDMRGFWKSKRDNNDEMDLATSGLEGAHFPDTFKKPNHPTFSSESQYHGRDGHVGGSWWQDQQGRWNFAPGETNLQHHSPKDLQQYFEDVEPNSALRMPPARSTVPEDLLVDEANKRLQLRNPNPLGVVPQEDMGTIPKVSERGA